MGGAHLFASTDGDIDTELCLRTGRNSSPNSCSSPPSSSSPSTLLHQPLTIFYAGGICICSVTPFQAGAIMAAAEREVKVMDPPRGTRSLVSSSGEEEVAAAAKTEAQGRCGQRPNDVLLALSPTQKHLPTAPQTELLLNAGLSRRRSLQRFLQKRKTRMTLDATPYARPVNRLHDPPAGAGRYLQKRNQQTLSLTLS